MTLEFTLCKGAVYELSRLKKSARRHSLSSGRPLHETLDKLAVMNGHPGGWQDVLQRRWTLRNGSTLYQLHPTTPLTRSIELPGKNLAPHHLKDRGVNVVVQKSIMGSLLEDRHRIIKGGRRSMPLSQAMLKNLEVFHAENNIEAACRFALLAVDASLHSHPTSYYVQITDDRRKHDMRADLNNHIDALYLLEHSEGAGRPALSLVVTVAPEGKDQVRIRAQYDDNHIDFRTARHQWIEVLQQCVAHYGLPEFSQEAARRLIQELSQMPTKVAN
jgi:hypothetical protein